MMDTKNKTMLKRIWQILMVVLINLLIITYMYATPSVTVLSKMGSKGDEVKQIQTVLSEKGYYSGKADGIYGAKTRDAVIKYQRDKGLTADGVAGTRTLTSLGIKKESQPGDSDVELLARLISAESRGEPYNGQVAVGACVLNRVQHPSFPDTIAGVIYQKGAFSCLDDGQFNEPTSDSSRKAARDAINGMDPSGGAIYYYNPNTATNKWIRSRVIIVTIGKHVFCE